MASKHMKGWLTSLIIMKIQIKITVRYHLTLIIKKNTNKKCWQRWEEMGTLVYCSWECKFLQPLWKLIQMFLKKLKIKLPYNSAFPFLGTYPQNIKIIIQKDTCIPYVHKSPINLSNEEATEKQNCTLSRWGHKLVQPPQKDGVNMPFYPFTVFQQCTLKGTHLCAKGDTNIQECCCHIVNLEELSKQL